MYFLGEVFFLLLFLLFLITWTIGVCVESIQTDYGENPVTYSVFKTSRPRFEPAVT